ncbi:hypothetical protein SY83_10215 [Paenibacillus swuensis]|uniref:Sialate O-acetylesterase domain-containing protein n=2 Tax=Paenibacillus swuensis TaxID=1178515 RepID=A0A172TPD8_9BACL|nr:hypothetical protein SY83_10215 [Paenibacillus swuensis]
MVSSFVIEYERTTGTPVVAVSCSKGGSSINLWLPGGAFLNDAIDRFQAASDWLGANGCTVRHAFMVWCQGETDAENGMSPAEYTTKLTSVMDAMICAGMETCYIVGIGRHRDDPDKFRPIAEAQIELCITYQHAALVSTKFADMAARGLMKDAFHYVQQAYNEVGAEAGANTAVHILGRNVD